MGDVDPDEVAPYAAEDADITLQLKTKFDPIIKENKLEKLLLEVESPLIDVLAAMEFEGVKIDTESLKEMSLSLEKESKEIEAKVYEMAGETFNLASLNSLERYFLTNSSWMPKPRRPKPVNTLPEKRCLANWPESMKLLRPFWTSGRW